MCTFKLMRFGCICGLLSLVATIQFLRTIPSGHNIMLAVKETSARRINIMLPPVILATLTF